MSKIPPYLRPSKYPAPVFPEVLPFSLKPGLDVVVRTTCKVPMRDSTSPLMNHTRGARMLMLKEEYNCMLDHNPYFCFFNPFFVFSFEAH